jgi:hypothetical protein
MIDAHASYLMIRMETVAEAEREVATELTGGLSRTLSAVRAARRADQGEHDQAYRTNQDIARSLCP